LDDRDALELDRCRHALAECREELRPPHLPPSFGAEVPEIRLERGEFGVGGLEVAPQPVHCRDLTRVTEGLWEQSRKRGEGDQPDADCRHDGEMTDAGRADKPVPPGPLPRARMHQIDSETCCHNPLSASPKACTNSEPADSSVWPRGASIRTAWNGSSTSNGESSFNSSVSQRLRWRNRSQPLKA